jgi:hypothetical protein
MIESRSAVTELNLDLEPGLLLQEVNTANSNAHKKINRFPNNALLI